MLQSYSPCAFLTTLKTLMILAHPVMPGAHGWHAPGYWHGQYMLPLMLVLSVWAYKQHAGAAGRQEDWRGQAVGHNHFRAHERRVHKFFRLPTSAPSTRQQQQPVHGQ